MIVLIKIIQVIFALSILVLVHEFGHFLFAKLFKTRVDKFYLFFNPKIALFKAKKFNNKWHFRFLTRNLPDSIGDESIDINTLPEDDWRRYPEHTEYGIGWVPLGGYCKIAGMIDESMDKKALKLTPKPWEFRTKPAWQRFFIMFGGVLFNFILAILIYAAILQTWGDSYLKNDNAKYGIAVNDLSYEIGFRNGDKIISLDGEKVDDFSQIQINLARSQVKEAIVVRNNDTVSIEINPVYLPAILKTPGMFDLAFPFVIGEIPKGSINEGAGLLPGDEIKAINSTNMFLVQEIQKELANHKSDNILATVERSNVKIEIPLLVDTAGKIQVLLENDLTKFFNITENSYSFLSAIPAGGNKVFKSIRNYIKELGLIFSPKSEAYKSVGSFITIGKIFPGTWDWYRVWSLTAMLSIMLGVMNLLPIPALDGGHILFLLVEIISGRKPSDKFLEIAQMIGMIFLLALMILAFGNDIKSLFI